jgi:hypothetical protein
MPALGINQGGTSEAFSKEGLKEVRVITTVTKPVEKGFNLGNKVSRVGSKGVISVDHSNNCTLNNTRGVTARGREVEIEILGLFKDLSSKPIIFNGDGEVQEVNRSTTVVNSPSESSKVIKGGLK